MSEEAQEIKYRDTSPALDIMRRLLKTTEEEKRSIEVLADAIQKNEQQKIPLLEKFADTKAKDLTIVCREAHRYIEEQDKLPVLQ